MIKNCKELGGKLKRLRGGFSLSYISSQTGVPIDYLERLEDGTKIETPSAHSIYKLACYYKYDLAELLKLGGIVIDKQTPYSEPEKQVAMTKSTQSVLIAELEEIKKAFQWTLDNMGTEHTSDHFNVPANGIQRIDVAIELIGKNKPYSHSQQATDFINVLRRETGCPKELAKRAYYEVNFEISKLDEAIQYIRSKTSKLS